MADVKISELTSAGAAREGDVIPVVRSGEADTRKATLPAFGGGGASVVVEAIPNAGKTFDLESKWSSWKNNVVQFTVNAGQNPKVIIRPNAAGSWSPADADKGSEITFHPMWRGGEIQLQNIKWARHDSDGEVSEHAKSATARSATEGHGEPFKLLFQDYYVGASLYPFHVNPITQDVALALADFGERTAGLAEVAALERKLDKVIDLLEGISHPYHETIAYSAQDNRYTWNMTIWNPTAEVRANGYKIKIEKGSHRLRLWAIWNDGSTDEYDGNLMLNEAGISEAKDDHVAAYILPTKNGNAVTAAKAALLLDVKTGALVNPAPQDIEWTLSDTQAASAIELVYGDTGDSGSLISNSNYILDSGPGSDTLRVYGSTGDLNAIRDLIEPDIGAEGASKIVIENNAGAIAPYRITAITANASTEVWNGDMHHIDLTIPVDTSVVPEEGQDLHFGVDDPVDEEEATPEFELTRAGSKDINVVTDRVFIASGITRPTSQLMAFTVGDINSADYDQDVLVYIRRAEFDALTAAAAGDTAGASNSLVIASNNSVWYRVGRTSEGEILVTTDADGTDLFPFVVYSVAGMEVEEAGSNDTTWTSNNNLTSTTITVPDSDVLAITLGSRITGEVKRGRLYFFLKSDLEALAHANAGATATGSNSIQIEAERGTVYSIGVTAADELLITSDVAAHDTRPVTLYSVSGIDVSRIASATIDVATQERFVATNIAIPSADVFAVVMGRGSTSATARLNRRELKMIRREEMDGVAASAAGQSASSSGGNAIQIDNFDGVYCLLGKDNAGNLIITSSNTSNGDYRDLVVYGVDTHTEDASGGATGQSGGSSGAYTTVRKQENLAQNMTSSSTTIRAGGNNGYAVDDDATHMQVDIVMPSNLNQTANLYYVDPDTDAVSAVLDADGDTITGGAGATLSHRFGEAFFKTIDGKRRLRLALVGGAAWSGGNAEVGLTHETDVNSAEITALTLLDNSVTVAAVARGNNLAGNNVTAVSLDHQVEWDEIISLTINFGTHPNLRNEQATARLQISKDEMDWVGAWSGGTTLAGRTDIPGWVSLGWVAIGTAQQLADWRAKPSSGFVDEYADRNNHAGRIIGLQRTGVYLTGLYCYAWTGPLVIENVSVMRRI